MTGAAATPPAFGALPAQTLPRISGQYAAQVSKRSDRRKFGSQPQQLSDGQKAWAARGYRVFIGKPTRIRPQGTSLGGDKGITASTGATPAAPARSARLTSAVGQQPPTALQNAADAVSAGSRCHLPAGPCRPGGPTPFTDEWDEFAFDDEPMEVKAENDEEEDKSRVI